MNSEDRASSLSRLVFTCKSVDELDDFFAEFNYQFVFARETLERIEDINHGLYAFGKEHPDGFVVYSMEGGEN